MGPNKKVLSMGKCWISVARRKHFAYNFVIKNAGDVLNFSIKLIHDKYRDIEFETGEKKFPIIESMIGFLAWIDLTKKRTRERHIEVVLIELEKDLENFQENILKKDKTMQEYVRLLKLTKQEFQILFQENKKLKENINSIEKGKNY